MVENHDALLIYIFLKQNGNEDNYIHVLSLSIFSVLVAVSGAHRVSAAMNQHTGLCTLGKSYAYKVTGKGYPIKVLF